MQEKNSRNCVDDERSHFDENLNIDMRMSLSRFSKGQSLSLVELDQLPSYLKQNQSKFKEWLA